MKQSVYMELRDIAQGDFAIRDGVLFYKEQRIATNGKPFFTSSEEIFFLFEVEDEKVATEFKKVIFLKHFAISGVRYNNYTIIFKTN